jgi:hypothetical protein
VIEAVGNADGETAGDADGEAVPDADGVDDGEGLTVGVGVAKPGTIVISFSGLTTVDPREVVISTDARYSRGES